MNSTALICCLSGKLVGLDEREGGKTPPLTLGEEERERRTTPAMGSTQKRAHESQTIYRGAVVYSVD